MYFHFGNAHQLRHNLFVHFIHERRVFVFKIKVCISENPALNNIKTVST